jgi:hypothetical protein
MIGSLVSGTLLLLRPVLGTVAGVEKRLTVDPGPIPEPCWYPEFAGEALSHVSEKTPGTLLLSLHNGGPTSRTFTLTSTPAIDIEPATLTVPARTSATAMATYELAPDATEHDAALVQLRVGGCRDHDVHWRVKPAKVGSGPVEVEIDDRPDYRHHWYDHFYCSHACTGKGR